MANSGVRSGASGQSHSMMRSKKLRTIPSRWRMVLRAGARPRSVPVALSQDLKPSMSARVTVAKFSTPVSAR